MGKEAELPKNIRQIGEIQGEEKVYLEDYVMTCIHKKEPQEKDGYLGIFYGEQKCDEDGTYVFVRGILEAPGDEGEDEFKAHLEEQQKKYFPDWEVQGCCVIGQYPTGRMKFVEAAVPDSVQLIYHLQEQEEHLYWTMEGRYKRIKGYFIFYEQNRRMQQYLEDQFREDSVEKESLPDKAIKSFREKVREKSGVRTGSMLKLAGSFFVVTVLVIGAIAVTRMDDIRRVQNVFDREGNTVENEASAEQNRIYSNETAGEGSGILAENSHVQGGNKTASGAFLQDSSQNTEKLEIPAALVGAGGISEDQSTNQNEMVQSSAAGTGDTGGVSDAAKAADGAPAVSGSTDSEIPTAGGGTDSEDPAANGGTDSEDPAASGSTDSEVPTASGGTDNAATAAGQETQAAAASSGQVRAVRASYIIRAGDTLADICNQYYGSLDKLDEICEVNRITDANMIMPGEKIVLP